MPKPKLTKSAKALLEYFRTFPAGEPITASRKELAKALNIGTASVSRAIKQLEELDYIRIESGKTEGAQNTYFLNLHTPSENDTPPATFVCKDFTPKANAVLKSFTPPAAEPEKPPVKHEITSVSATVPLESLPQLYSIIPEYHIAPINRLANELQHNIINAGAVDLIVAGKNKKNEVTSYTIVTYEDTSSITMTGKPYTEYDRQVHDAVCSLWEYGHQDKLMTSDMIFRAMTHNTKTNDPSPQQIGAVTKSIEKMRRIHVKVDATTEMKKLKVLLNGEPVTSCKFNEFLLSLRELEVTTGGKTVIAYKLLGEPVLLTYARMTKQLATVSAELLDIKEIKDGKATNASISNSEKRIAVKGYLLRRVAVMKADKKNKSQKQSNIILFDSLFEETGIQNNSRTARNIKEYCYQVLDYWKITGFIKNYNKRESKGKGRKSIDAVVISI